MLMPGTHTAAETRVIVEPEVEAFRSREKAQTAISRNNVPGNPGSRIPTILGTVQTKPRQSIT